MCPTGSWRWSTLSISTPHHRTPRPRTSRQERPERCVANTSCGTSGRAPAELAFDGFRFQKRAVQLIHAIFPPPIPQYWEIFIFQEATNVDDEKYTKRTGGRLRSHNAGGWLSEARVLTGQTDEGGAGELTPLL